MFQFLDSCCSPEVHFLTQARLQAVEAASSQTGTFSDQLALLARLESICSSATLEGEMLGDTSGAAEAMRGLEASVTAHFEQVFQSGMESIDATVSAVLKDPRSTCANKEALKPFRDLISQLSDPGLNGFMMCHAVCLCRRDFPKMHTKPCEVNISTAWFSMQGHTNSRTAQDCKRRLEGADQAAPKTHARLAESPAAMVRMPLRQCTYKEGWTETMTSPDGWLQDWTRQSCNLLEQQLPKLQMQAGTNF